MRSSLALVPTVSAIVFSGVARVSAQEGPARPAEHGAAVDHASHERDDEHSPFVEVEFAGSTIFQSGGASVKLGSPLGSPLRAEVRYFGLDGNDMGVAGLGWEVRWGALRVIPGVAWGFGRENRPAAAITMRWAFENGAWISQGVWVQSLGEYRAPAEAPDEHGGHATEEETIVKRASVLDGIHVSRRLGRVELGPLVEHIRYREENAWKGGARVAVRLGKAFRLVGEVVGPDTELRGGLVWEM